MDICVAGLGLIGGCICMALKRAGYRVDGWNRSQKPLEYALENKIIDGAAQSFEKYDVVFVALPPEATLKFINGATFKDGAVVSDICGVKRFLRDKIVKRNFNYVGCHPMAGKEVSGIENACADLFSRASMVITSDESTNSSALDTVKLLTKAMDFKYIVECSAEVHDRKIAYTSQLAHIVSNAYVKDEEIDGCLGFTGGSFQDMTRIAGVDEKIWASLYLNNAENLSKRLQKLINSLEEIKSAVDGGDESVLESVLKQGRLRFENCKKAGENNGITVTRLK